MCVLKNPVVSFHEYIEVDITLIFNCMGHLNCQEHVLFKPSKPEYFLDFSGDSCLEVHCQHRGGTRGKISNVAGEARQTHCKG